MKKISRGTAAEGAAGGDGQGRGVGKRKPAKKCTAHRWWAVLKLSAKPELCRQGLQPAALFRLLLPAELPGQLEIIHDLGIAGRGDGIKGDAVTVLLADGLGKRRAGVFHLGKKILS